MFSSTALAITCDDLNGAYLYSQESAPVYLGFFGGQYATESINNQYGTYGSEFNALSVRNTFGAYGSTYGSYSAQNQLTTTPPGIYKNNVLIGYLTNNQFVTGGIGLASIDSSCVFTATGPSIPSAAPADLANLTAETLYTISNLSWSISSGAAGYNVYQCPDASCNSTTTLGTVSTAYASVTGLNSSQTYYFAVQPYNDAGYGGSGIIEVTTLTDGVAPEIVLVGDASINHEQGVAYNDAGASASDAVDGVVTVTTSGTVDINTAGTYTITYSAIDAAGNAATEVTRTVIVADSVGPTITLFGAATINHQQGVTYADAGASAADVVDGAVDVNSTGTVDISTANTYTITYSAIDAAGNAATEVTRTVIVADSVGPTITLFGNETLRHKLGDVYTDAGASAADAVDGAVDVTTNGTVDINLLDTYIITYSAIDAAGNAATEVTRSVIVVELIGTLDIDGNGQYDALTDGLLLLRGMFGLDGSALVTGTIASDAAYTESVDIESRIETLGNLADIDGNGDIDALTDGLLTLRYLFGLQGDTLINGVVAVDATRKTAEEIEAHLETLMPAL